ncbi:hypothetical protein TURU_000155 [Turdus rufiventris]|nr:hypothetical protein TURU_000155 [Turdus rufiventris]
MWEILRLPWCPEPFIESSSRIILALLFQVFFSTEEVPEEVDNLWRECRKKHRLPASINSFAVQTVRALLCRLRCLDLRMALVRKQGWDTLLCADTHHYAMGLLAREMRRVSSPLCSGIGLHLLQVLSTQEPRWDLPALAFLVEVLECLDLTKCGHSVLRILSRHLKSKYRERCRLALRGLVVLSKDPSLDNSHIQLLSIRIFCKVMELVVEEGKKALKTQVCQSLLPLFLHSHDENQRVAEVSTRGLLVSPWQGELGSLLPWHLLGCSLLQTLAQEHGSCALNCSAISASLLPSRPLGKRWFVRLGS